MKRLIRHSPYLIGILILLALIFSLTFSVWAAPQADPGINKVYISNVRDSSFTVSWTTDIASDGTVNYGTTTPPGSSQSDTNTNTTTHFVEIITDITPETTYYVSVTSDTATDDNGSAYCEVTTGPTLGIPPSGGQVYGVLHETDGTTPVPNAIVYLQLQDNNEAGSPGNSQWVSIRTDSSGNWGYNLPNTRTSDLSAYYNYTTGEDNLRLDFQCGDKGNIGEYVSEVIVSIPTADPGDLGSTSCDDVPNAITLSDFNAREGNNLQLLPFLGLVAMIILAAILIWRLASRRAQA
jgi:hypothetical protein